MAQNASDSQKIDFLWKKIVYGAAKTDISGNIDATNEPNPSPLLIRGDKIIQQASLIANVIPASNSSVVTVYPTTLPIECISTAAIPTPTLTWQTGQTFWIPPEFGSTYQIKVYISPSGQAGNVLTKGTQVFATGTTNNDLWVFDYQAGILNFNSNNTPYSGGAPISFTGNSVYISGAVYSGAFGLPSATSVGNITFSNTTISTAFTNGNIYFSPSGTGTVQFTGNAAIGLPYGTDATRPLYPVIGYTRFNTNRQSIEYYDGTQWLAPGEAVISSQTINPDGSANAFALSSNTSTAGVLVSINGTLQQPTSAYVIVGNNQIQFTEIPLTTDIVEVRYISVGAVTVGSLQFQNTTFVTLDSANVNITGNLLPSANVTYSLGSQSLQWKDLWVSGNSIYIGGSALTVTNGQLSIGGNIVGGGSTYSNVNVAAYVTTNGLTNYSNVNVSALITTNGLTNYSNVNTAAYTTAMGYQNFGNVNVAAYVTTANSAVIGYVDNKVSTANIGVIGYIDLANTIQSNQITAANLGIKGYIDNSTSTANIGMKGYVDSVATLSSYSNVNVSALITTNGLTNYSNVNVVAYLAGNITVGNITTAGSILAVPAWTSAGNITITATTTNPGKGTTTFDNISYRQLGAKQWEVVLTYIQTVANGVNGTGDYLVTLPNGLSFDTTLPSQQITTTDIGTNTYALMSYIIPSGSGLINNESLGGQVYPLVYNATKFRILTTSYGSAIQCWGSGYYALGGDDPKIQLTFRFTST